ncbi:MAG TPA: hypothetical protein VN879_18165 [Candidatus Acidoferrales bacterium]|nr:hypothetical protein [Candidatus Acidoferrales bacterium]
MPQFAASKKKIARAILGQAKVAGLVFPKVSEFSAGTENGKVN